jgi:outer membrane usher protein
VTTRVFSAGVTVRTASDHYATLSLDPATDRPLLDTTMFVSVPVVRRITMSNTYALDVSRDHGVSGMIGTGFNITIEKGVTLWINATRSHTTDGGNPFEAFATLTVALGAMTSASVGQHMTDGTQQTQLSVEKPLPVGTGYGYRATATLGPTDQAEVAASAQIEQGRLQAIVDASSDSPATETLEVAGSIVYVPGAGLFAARPVQDAFAVLQVPGVGGVRGYINNQEVGRTGSSGNLLLPGLLPYYGNRVEIAPSDLPLQYDIASTEEVVAPPYRGVAVVRMHVKELWYVRGTVKVRLKDKVVPPSYGEMTVTAMDGTKLVSPIGREGEFELEVTNASAGTYPAHIVHGLGECDFSLVVPPSTGSLVNVGEVECVQP